MKFHHCKHTRSLPTLQVLTLDAKWLRIPIPRYHISPRIYHVSVRRYHGCVWRYHVSVRRYHASVRRYHASGSIVDWLGINCRSWIASGLTLYQLWIHSGSILDRRWNDRSSYIHAHTWLYTCVYLMTNMPPYGFSFAALLGKSPWCDQRYIMPRRHSK